MKPIDENQRNRYFTELAVALKREGLETMPLKDWQLPVLMDGHPICQISCGGNVRYRPEEVAAETMEQALQPATDTADTVSEYMGLMEAAPTATTSMATSRLHSAGWKHRSITHISASGLMCWSWHRTTDS